MFNKIYTSATPYLAFLKSSTVKTFPSGRRRSEEIDKDGSTNTADDKYYIPFDPEARLNTEANARKHSGLNGYAQTYLKEWDRGTADKNGRLLLSLEGYLFDIELSSLKTPDAFGSEIATQLGATTESSIYANIILEDVHLYSSASGLPEYCTSILRDQINAKNNDSSYAPSTSLDLLNSDTLTIAETAIFSNYYFSGLSFSVEPLTEKEGRDSILPRTVQRGTTINNTPINRNQQVVSLRILEKVDKVDAEGNIIYEEDEEGNSTSIPQKEWKIYQPALLPFIEHDIDEDSVKMGETRVRKNLTVEENATITKNFTVTDRVEVTTETTKVKNKLVVENDVEVLENKITTKDLTSTDTILANNIGTSTSKVTKITARDADIETLSGDDIQQKVKVEGNDAVKVTEDYYDVPVVFVREITTGGKTEHQLQITRVNKLN